jgi:hypothetical protein
MPIPKVCRAGHDWIVFDEDDNEDCPLCAAEAKANKLQAEIDELEQNMIFARGCIEDLRAIIKEHAK